MAAGGYVTLSLAGYERYDLLGMTMGTIPLGTVGTDVNGQARVTVRVPVGTAAGKYTVTVSGSDGAPTATVVLTVTG